MNTLKAGILGVFFFLVSIYLISEEENLVENPSFSDGLNSWSGMWTRDKDAGRADHIILEAYSKPGSLKIEYSSSRDWSFGQVKKIPVKEGAVYEMSGMVKCDGVANDVELCIVTGDKDGNVMDWLYSIAKTRGTHDWMRLKRKFIIPPGCGYIQFRMIGNGQGTSYWDDLSLIKKTEATGADQDGKPLLLSNKRLSVSYSPAGNIFDITDRKSGTLYTVRAYGKNTTVIHYKLLGKDRLSLALLNPDGEDLEAEVKLTAEGEVLFTLKGGGPFDGELSFPGAILSEKGQSWVVPVNEGLLIPADDPHFNTHPLVLFSGHGLCMPFIGLTNGKEGMLAIAETYEDAGVNFIKPAGEKTSSWSFFWLPSKQHFGYERKIRLVFSAGVGHTGIARAYRRYAAAKGLVVPLSEKAKTVPAVKKLPGAVNLWFWADAPSWRGNPAKSRLYAEKIRNAGIERVLWSSGDTASNVEYINSLGFISGRYDCYQDVYGPDMPAQWVNKKGWPDDIILLPSGDWMKGWVTRYAGKEYPGGVICAKQSLLHMKESIPEDLKEKPYKARFLDTTTASPLRECYHPGHPGTRIDDRKWKSAMLSYLSEDLKLITGSETGMDWAVPYVHYFEGMMSLGPYRLPDAGYDLTTYIKPDKNFLRFQTGPEYRIPLFELVYHDCMVAYWYWGDSSNRVPEVWADRDLYNALYGNPPLWIVDCRSWDKNRDRFLRSYRNGTRTALLTAFSEMTSHAFLTEDHNVQQTVFANGTRVWVNFDGKTRRLPSGQEILPKSFLVISGN
ncbi:MAG: hypothetical protein JW969_11295 [Spirochaetales bacterium]|nr:hypothetical protein [Spirochaetales bacterium]